VRFRARNRQLRSLAALGVGVLAAALAALAGGTGAPRPRLRQAAPLFDPALTHSMLEEPGRDRWQQPARIVEALGLRPGAVVADLGSGSGYLLPYLSRAVGPEGTVYAEEIQPAFMPPLERRARTLGNVRPVLGTATDPKLPPHALDSLTMLTVYHEVEEPVALLRRLRGLCRGPESRLAIIDFDATRHGTPPAPFGHEVWEQDVLTEARAAGWVLVARHEFLSSQFFLVFRPAS
jgi:hypothetical protein